MKPFSFYLDKAKAEVLLPHALRSIQRETAWTWCGRACVAQSHGLATDAIEYAHEAIEHAALCGDDVVLRAVRSALLSYGISV